jgi:polar amino acid transport system substrate-binding protein
MAAIEFVAGVKQQLESDAARLSELRLLSGRFMVIEQAMGTPNIRLQKTVDSLPAL